MKTRGVVARNRLMVLWGAAWGRREPLVIPGIVHQPFHEHAGTEAETS